MGMGVIGICKDMARMKKLTPDDKFDKHMKRAAEMDELAKKRSFVQQTSEREQSLR